MTTLSILGKHLYRSHQQRPLYKTIINRFLLKITFRLHWNNSSNVDWIIEKSDNLMTEVSGTSLFPKDCFIILQDSSIANFCHHDCHISLLVLLSSNLCLIFAMLLPLPRLLTLYHAFLTFNNPTDEDFWKLWKHCGEKEKMLVTSIFSFFTQCFLLYQREKLSLQQCLLCCHLQMLPI